MSRFKIRVIKTWDFSLNADSKEEVEKRVLELMNDTVILELPETRKRIRLKIKQIKERNFDNEENY